MADPTPAEKQAAEEQRRDAARATPQPPTLSPAERQAQDAAEVKAAQARLNPPAPPKPVPLREETDPDGTKLDKPPAPITVDGKPVPRVVHENARAPGEMRDDKGKVLWPACARWKVSCRNYGDQPTLYILTAHGPDAEKHARATYFAHTLLQDAIDQVRASGGDPVVPHIHCKLLAD